MTSANTHNSRIIFNPFASEKSESGATYIEFAISAMLFFFVVLVTMESAVAGFRALTCQYVASNTVRSVTMERTYTSVNKKKPWKKGPKKEMNSVDRVQEYARLLALSLGLRITDNDVQVCHYKNVNPDTGTCDELNMGIPEEYIAVRVQTQVPFFLGTWQINLVGYAAARKERS